MRAAICALLFALAACRSGADTPASSEAASPGFTPDIIVGDVPEDDRAALQDWIDQSVSILTSPEFDANLDRVAQRYPDVWISRSRDAMPMAELRDVLRAEDNRVPALWWPRATVVIKGEATATTGASSETTGEIEIGRLHFARYLQGDIVERSCAINTMAHEIAHTLSDRRDKFWMHILDSGKDGNPPPGMFEASYLIGAAAQCTWLQDHGRVPQDGFFDCLLTFSDPASGSRFRSRACDDFPDNKPLTPAGRLQ